MRQASLWFVVAAMCVCGAIDAQQAKPPCVPTVTGDLRVEHLHSEVFHDDQTLRIWLPPGYDLPGNAQRHYPVLYLLDGENLFDVCTSSFHHEWKVDETLTQLIAAGRVEPLIVVGIDSPGKRRTEEYLPYADGLLQGGVEVHGQKFPAFLVDEVQPLIQKAYRVKTGRRFTGIGGSSYGAVAALFALIERPDVFGLGLLESTSVQAGNGELVRRTRDLACAPLRVSVGVGTNEVGASPELAERLGVSQAQMNAVLPWGSERIAENLKSSGTGQTQVRLVETPGARHEEAAWAERLPGALQFLFPGKQAGAAR